MKQQLFPIILIFAVIATAFNFAPSRRKVEDIISKQREQGGGPNSHTTREQALQPHGTIERTMESQNPTFAHLHSRWRQTVPRQGWY